MGIYDRDYYREEERPGLSSYVPQSVVVAIIAVNVAFWIADFFSPVTAVDRSGDVAARWLSDHMAVHVETLTHPWLWWQFLTAGFAHSPTTVQHLLFNMLGLYFLGGDVEQRYGSKEFLRLYLAMVVFASIVWCLVNRAVGAPGMVAAYGASGAISGVVVLYAFNFPRRTLLLFFVIPIPAWLAGVLLVGLDVLGASGTAGETNIAYSMHLAGAAFALAYYQFGWNLTALRLGNLALPRFRRQPRLHIHTPEEEREPTGNLSEEVDQILEKIYREGEASLTARERKTLEAASQEYQRKKMAESGRSRNG